MTKDISGDEFKYLVEKNPKWATEVTEPIHIHGCELEKSPISHLSPLLHFHPKAPDDRAASFWSCQNLRVARGTFHGWVTFAYSAIEEIDPDNLIIHNTNNLAAIFYHCDQLKVATGNFNGHVKFARSGIERIKNLNLQTRWPDKRRIDLRRCQKLKSAPREILFGPGLSIDSATRENLLRQYTRETLRGETFEI